MIGRGGDHTGSPISRTRPQCECCISGIDVRLSHPDLKLRGRLHVPFYEWNARRKYRRAAPHSKGVFPPGKLSRAAAIMDIDWRDIHLVED